MGAQMSRSSGLLTANGIPTGCPTPTHVTGFDVIVKTAAALATVQVYNGSNAGTLLAQGTAGASANVGTTVQYDFSNPIRADSGAWVELTTANAVLRWA